MVSEQVSGRAGQGDTQMDAIRDLMAEAATNGAWLTLGEIAAHTQFGEASISAQLRHLRKPKHGHYCIAKRIRTRIYQRGPANAGDADDAGGEADHVGIVWEYRIVSATGAAVSATDSAVSATAAAVSWPTHALHGAGETGAGQPLLCAAPPEVESAQAREPEFSLHTREGGDPCQSE